MDEKDKIEFKKRLKQVAIDCLMERIEASSMAMNDAQKAANDEGRSTVGDKHQTGRAMAHIDRDIHARQLDTAQKEFSFVLKTYVTVLSNKIDIGAYAETSEGNYFFLVGLGQTDVDGKKVFYLSISSPIGKIMAGKSAGEKISFNGKEILINNVF